MLVKITPCRRIIIIEVIEEQLKNVEVPVDTGLPKLEQFESNIQNDYTIVSMDAVVKKVSLEDISISVIC